MARPGLPTASRSSWRRRCRSSRRSTTRPSAAGRTTRPGSEARPKQTRAVQDASDLPWPPSELLPATLFPVSVVSGLCNRIVPRRRRWGRLPAHPAVPAPRPLAAGDGAWAADGALRGPGDAQRRARTAGLQGVVRPSLPQPAVAQARLPNTTRHTTQRTTRHGTAHIAVGFSGDHSRLSRCRVSVDEQGATAGEHDADDRLLRGRYCRARPAQGAPAG